MRRFSRIGQGGGVMRGVLLCALILVLGASEARAAAQALLAPTPLILKDGRIASVAVHVLSFRQGAEALDAQGSAELRELTREAATDCFLTAQVIGHVGLAEISANDTLGAHRLARSRADSVQAALIGGGLPVNAIASVWDWQFMVREPRATIWLFRLTKGEDCEGTPLEPGAPALVADADPDPAGTGAAAPEASEPMDRTPRASADAGQAAARATRQPATPADATETRDDEEVGKTAPQPSRPTMGRTPRSEKATAAATPAPEQDARVAKLDGRAPRAEPETARAPEARGKAAQPRSEAGPSQQAAQSPPAGPARAESDPGGARPGSGRAQAGENVPAHATGPKATAAEQPAGHGQTKGDTATQAPDARLAARTEETREPAAAGGGARQGGSAALPPAGRRPSGVPTVIQALPALSPTPPASAGTSPEAAPATKGSQRSVVATAEAAQPAAAGQGGEPALVITFANNSSYFPPATARDLQALAQELEPGRRYRVRLTSAVSSSEQVVGASTAAEAERYNRWLAERRVERVEEWLAGNVSGPQLDIETAFVQEDNSRQVRIRIAPAG